MKQCTVCGETKNLSAFGADKYKKSGLKPQCKACRVESQRTWRATADAKRKAKIYRRDNAEILQAKKEERYKGSPERLSIPTKVFRAIESGKLTREPCSVCGATEYVDGHHNDYTKPLDVVWLCRTHHRRLHQQMLDVV